MVFRTVAVCPARHLLTACVLLQYNTIHHKGFHHLCAEIIMLLQYICYSSTTLHYNGVHHNGNRRNWYTQNLQLDKYKAGNYGKSWVISFYVSVKEIETFIKIAHPFLHPSIKNCSVKSNSKNIPGWVDYPDLHYGILGKRRMPNPVQCFGISSHLWILR